MKRKKRGKERESERAVGSEKEGERGKGIKGGRQGGNEMRQKRRQSLGRW